MKKIDIQELQNNFKDYKDININLIGMINTDLNIENSKIKFDDLNIIIENENTKISIEKRFIKNILADNKIKKIEIEFDCYQKINLFLN